MTAFSDVKDPDNEVTRLASRVGFQSMLEFYQEVNLGTVPGHSLVHKFGRNPDAGTSSEDIHYGGGVLTPLVAAATMEAISGDAEDDVDGDNARTIRIWGIDGSFNIVTADIIMNGTSVTTATTQEFLRVYRARILTCGTYNVDNAGDIIIRVSSAGATQLTMEAGTGVSQTSHYTVEVGYTAYIVRAAISVDSTKTSRIILASRGNTNLLAAPFDPVEHLRTWDGVTGVLPEAFLANYIIAEKTDIWFESVAGGVNTPLEIDYDMLLVANGV